MASPIFNDPRVAARRLAPAVIIIGPVTSVLVMLLGLRYILSIGFWHWFAVGMLPLTSALFWYGIVIFFAYCQQRHWRIGKF